MRIIVLLVALSFVNGSATGQIGSHQKISSTDGGFSGQLSDGDQFGLGLGVLGDLDRDGNTDLAVSARLDDDGGSQRGAVWILFLRADGTVKAQAKISSVAGSFTGPLADGDIFGNSLDSIGDLDSDGNTDIAVTARLDDDGGLDRGAVWIIFLATDGSVKAEQKISSTQGDFNGILEDADNFGQSVAGLGDVNGDGTEDIAVGAYFDGDGGFRRGAVWVLFLNSDGTVKAYQKISDTEGGFDGFLDDEDYFGSELANLGDLDGDGVIDLGVGAAGDDDGDRDAGAIWILFLNSDGSVKSSQKISKTSGGGYLEFPKIGYAIDAIGDWDGDMIQDLGVGEYGDQDTDRAVSILLMRTDGTVKRAIRISNTSGGLEGVIPPQSSFGVSVRALDDLDGDGGLDFIVGASQDDDGGTDRGAIWLLYGVPEPLFPPMLESPADASTEVPLDPLLSWQQQQRALSYSLDVATSVGFAAPVISEIGLVSPSYQVAGLDASTKYYWRVRAEGLQGQSDWSPTWSFTTTGFVLQAPTPIQPESSATDVSLTPALVWTAVAAATSYNVQVANSPTFSTLLLDQQVVGAVSFTISTPLQPLRVHYWRIKAIGMTGESDWSDTSFFTTSSGVGVDSPDGPPMRFALYQNHPNPFNPTTTISFDVSQTGPVTLTVVDVLGRQISELASGIQPAGTNEITFDATGIPSGVYVYRLQAGVYVETKRMVVVK